jgi:flagellar motor switch protein FliM
VATLTREPMSWEELEQTKEYNCLSPQQKLFVKAWIDSGGNVKFAASVAYSMRNEVNARKLGHGLLHRVRNVIDIYLRKTEEQKYVDELDRILKARRPNPIHLQALKIKGVMKFGTDDPKKIASLPDAPVTVDTVKTIKVGDVLPHGNDQFEVIEIAVDGHPTKVKRLSDGAVITEGDA